MISIIGLSTGMILCVIGSALQFVLQHNVFGFFLLACAIFDCVLLIKVGVLYLTKEGK